MDSSRPQMCKSRPDGSPKVSDSADDRRLAPRGEKRLTRTEQFLPYFQNEVTDETAVRREMPLGRLAAVHHDPGAPARGQPCRTIRGGTRSVQRPSTIPAFAALLSDAPIRAESRLGSQDGPGELRDAHDRGRDGANEPTARPP